MYCVVRSLRNLPYSKKSPNQEQAFPFRDLKSNFTEDAQYVEIFFATAI